MKNMLFYLKAFIKLENFHVTGRVMLFVWLGEGVGNLALRNLTLRGDLL